MSLRYKIRKSKDYFKSQYDICFSSELFTDKNAHGSKIIMLFAEVFPFIVDEFGLNNSSIMISQFSNSRLFKDWFWRIKHKLGEYKKADPTYYDIGIWIGKGLFLKILVSFIYFHNLYISENVLKKAVKKQLKLLNEIINCREILYNINYDYSRTHYTLLSEKTVLALNDNLFYIENTIQ